MTSLWCLVILVIVGCVLADETDYNVINSDGSYAFGLSNNDIGAHYHSGTGSINNVVRGRYGSRNPSNRRVEETVYSAGPRGFRARGPTIHRKMDLSQIPTGPIGSLDDPLADPYDEPTYAFKFRTSEYQRREDSDRSGRVTGLYSYLDDIGEKHSVRYGAGANTGFHVSNAVPDAPSTVRYSAPLYKTSNRARGRIAYERGPGGQYKFIAAGPDQRRSESTDADGITRGSYSYLDDKGIQRTVQYIAGAGIGYRVVQQTTGPGTHLAPRPAIPEFGITAPQSNDISDDDGTGFKTAESGLVIPERNPGAYENKDISLLGRVDGGKQSSNSDFYQDNDEIKDRDHLYKGENDHGSRYSDRDDSHQKGSAGSYGSHGKYDASNLKGESQNIKSSKNRGSTRYDTKNGFTASGSNRNNDFDQPYVSRDQYDLEHRRNKDWNDSGRDSTIVKNVGDWFVGLPPGSAVRAHVQNIDLLPLGGRQPSPSDALRLDEKRSKKL